MVSTSRRCDELYAIVGTGGYRANDGIVLALCYRMQRRGASSYLARNYLPTKPRHPLQESSRVMIRPYQTTDLPALAAAHNVLYPTQPRTSAGFHDHFRAVERSGGHIWVIVKEETVAGYAAVTPVPGLTGLVELEGFIVPGRQRQGLGSRLLAQLLSDLQATDIKQVSHCVTTLDGPAARFLLHHHFFVEHEEWIMVGALQGLVKLPVSGKPIQYLTTRTLSNRTAVIHQFCALYERSFSGTRWYQPYTSTEVAATLASPADILFLMQAGRPIGFAWMRLLGADMAEIEPIGVVKQYQGQGLGRFLLLSSLRRLANQGIERVQLGVWRDNTAAVSLYRSLGFQHRRTLTYLAYDVAHPTVES